jgi:hypothetical protein
MLLAPSVLENGPNAEQWDLIRPRSVVALLELCAKKLALDGGLTVADARKIPHDLRPLMYKYLGRAKARNLFDSIEVRNRWGWLTMERFKNGLYHGAQESWKANYHHYAEYREGKAHGVDRYTIGGLLKYEIWRENGVLHGPFKWCYEGKLRESGNFVHGQPHGDFYWFDSNGGITKHYRYDMGSLVDTKS